MSKHSGRGGMGSHKHGISGHVGPSARTKFQRALEDNRARANAKRKKPPLHGSVKDALDEFKPK